MPKLFKWKVFILFFFFIASCGRTNVYIKIRRGASINIDNIKYIAILALKQTKIKETVPEFQEPKKIRKEDILTDLVKKEGEGREISLTKYNLNHWEKVVSNTLFEKLLQQEYYQIIAYAQVDKILAAQKLTLREAINKDTAKDMGRLLGVEGVVFGEVRAFCEDTRGKEYVEKEVGTGKYQEVTKKDLLSGKDYKSQEEIMERRLILEDYLLREVSVSTDLQMVNTKTGNIVGTISKSFSHQVKALGSFEMSHMSFCETIGKTLTNSMIDAVVKELSPHYIKKVKTLEYGKDKSKIVKLGVTYAKEDLWEEAFQQWNKALEINSNDASVYNNLGIYYEKKGLFQEALKAYKEALKLNPSNKVYMKNLCEIKKEIAEQEKAEK